MRRSQPGHDALPDSLSVLSHGRAKRVVSFACWFWCCDYPVINAQAKTCRAAREARRGKMHWSQSSNSRFKMTLSNCGGSFGAGAGGNPPEPGMTAVGTVGPF